MSFIIYIPKKDVALVKTGIFAGVYTEGICFRVPLLNEIYQVNLEVFSVEISRSGKNKNQLKALDVFVDIDAVFNLKIERNDTDIIKALESFGKETFNLRTNQTIESILDGALRDASSLMTLDNLQGKREDFLKHVSESLEHSLKKLGITLITPSLKSLRQTDSQFLDDSDIFGARTKSFTSKEIFENKTKENEYIKDNELSINRKNVDTQKTLFELNNEQEKSRIEMEKQIVEYSKDREIAISKAQAEQEQKKQEAEITKDIKIQEARKLEYLAKKNTFNALQESNEAETSAETVKAKAIAEREKQVAILHSEQLAEASLISKKKEAEAQKYKIEQEVEANFNKISKEAEANLIKARSEAEAIKLLAEAKQKDLEAEAIGKQKINEAENTLHIEIIKMRTNLATIERLPQILKELASPISNIKDFKVINVGGLNGSSNANEKNTSSNGINDIYDGAFNYKLKSSLADKIFAEAGIDIDKLQKGEIPNFSVDPEKKDKE